MEGLAQPGKAREVDGLGDGARAEEADADRGGSGGLCGLLHLELLDAGLAVTVSCLTRSLGALMPSVKQKSRHHRRTLVQVTSRRGRAITEA
ncbi:hypothetical protein GCM10027090_14270 [Sinomonas soli]